MDNLGYNNIPSTRFEYTPVQEIDTVEFSGTNTKALIASIENGSHEIASINSLTRSITLAKIPVRTPGSNYTHVIDIQIEPTQDFMSENIIENIRNIGDIEILNFAVSSTELPITRNAIIKTLKDQPELCKVIIEKYCDILSYSFKRVQHQRPLMNQRRKTSNEIYSLLSKDHPSDNADFELTPDSYELLTTNYLDSYQQLFQKRLPKKYKKLQENLKNIGSNFHGFEGADKANLSLKHTSELNQEIETNMLQKVRQGDSKISVDTKYFYMDNGHYLYKDIIYKSPYHNYFKKEIELIMKYHAELKAHIQKSYYGLGVGDGSKDFALTHDAYIPGNTLLMDGSAKSLKEAEVLFTGNNMGFRGMIGSFDGISFSQDRIDKLPKDKLTVSLSMFASPRERTLGMPDIRETTNTFSMLGGTYGNFSPSYKKIFLQNMQQIMNSGDTLMLSLFKTPKDQAGIDDIIKHYKSPEVDRFIKNYFIKLGIDKDKIEVQYNYKNDTVHIDALIKSDPSHPTTINFNGELVHLQHDTLFQCFQSERMNREKMEEQLEGTDLKIISIVTDENNPYEIYVIEKK